MFTLIGIVLLFGGIVLTLYNRRMAAAFAGNHVHLNHFERSTVRQNIAIVGSILVAGGILFIYLSWR